MDRPDEVMEQAVEQVVELDASAEEVWRALTEPGDLEAWLGEEVELTVRPGGTGRVVDDGVARLVRVDEVDEGRQLAFRWWDEADGEGGASRVVITVLPGEGGCPTQVRVREIALQRAAPSTEAWASSLRWEVRLACLTLALSAFALV